MREVGIHSRDGFEIGLELTAKARRLGRPVAELPTIWLDRTAGESNFKLAAVDPACTCAGTASPSAARRCRTLRAEAAALVAADAQAHPHRLAVDAKRAPSIQRSGNGKSRKANKSWKRSSSPVPPDSSAATSSRSCCARATRSSASTTTPSTGRSRSPTTTTRTTSSSRATCRTPSSMTELLADCDHFIAGAALIGGISYFHTYAYDLLAAERAHHRLVRATPRSPRTKAGTLKKVTYMSSSMVFESTRPLAVPGGRRAQVPPPLSSYGFQKLAVEYFARAAWDQYQLAVHDRPAVQLRRHRRIARARRRRDRLRQREARDEPRRARPGAEGPQGPGPAAHPRRGQPGPPLHLRRRPRAAASSSAMSTTRPRSTTTSTSRPRPGTPSSSSPRSIWRKIKGPDAPLRLVHDPAFEYDVQQRVPDVDQGQGGPRIRGDHHPRGHARRGHPVDRQAIDDGTI